MIDAQLNIKQQHFSSIMLAMTAGGIFHLDTGKSS
jgi:hypothetical protein